ncbi:MAG: alanine--tRNA ligase-related protein, partial [Candidatus Woesearchaeota archaeon]
MTKALYMNDSYLKEFEAVVESVKDDKFVVLDQTAFYPNGGGQPFDTGKIIRVNGGKEFNVVFTGKFDGNISHEVDSAGLITGDRVKGVVDWDRRYQLMKS